MILENCNFPSFSLELSYLSSHCGLVKKQRKKERKKEVAKKERKKKDTFFRSGQGATSDMCRIKRVCILKFRNMDWNFVFCFTQTFYHDK
jgi:hypothetical protein